ncbi:MAG TPA: class I SAM-dependent methyltransferase [Chthoniobacterales bacterium]|nr:class I SAM-dependent methyltransferase [Chthoniobacterales bacterium]
MKLARPVAVVIFHVLGRIQALAASMANRGRKVPREYRAFDVSKLLRAHRVAQRMADGEEILDVGCGDGGLLRDLGMFRSFARRVGIDLHRAEPPDPSIEMAAYDGEALPFPDASFDSVLFAYFLHYLRRDHAVRLLEEGRRVARKNLFILDDSQPEWSFWYRLRNYLERLRSDILYRAVSPERYRSAGNEEMYLTYAEWSALLGKISGGAVVEVEPLDRVSGLIHHTLFHARLAPSVPPSTS